MNWISHKQDWPNFLSSKRGVIETPTSPHPQNIIFMRNPPLLEVAYFVEDSPCKANLLVELRDE